MHSGQGQLALDREEVRVKIPKAQSSHRRCVVCSMPFRIENLKQQSTIICEEAIVDCFVETGILIKRKCRCCASHLIENSKKLSEDALNLIQACTFETTLSEDDVTFLLVQLRERAKNNSIFEQFKHPFATPELLVRRTCGVSKSDFNELLEFLSSMNNTKERTKSQALAIYLFWLKTGVTQDIISAYFDLKLTQREISHYCEQVRVSFSDFVKKNLGAACRTRDEWVCHNSSFCEVFYQSSVPKESAPRLFLIADGTYLFCQKSFNNEFQRLTYSVQKNVINIDFEY